MQFALLAVVAPVLVCTGDEIVSSKELDVPFETTAPVVIEEMLRLANVHSNDVIYDLGCGDGRIVVAAAKQYGTTGVGIDLDPQRIREAKETAHREGVSGSVEFMMADIFEADISPATVVTLYLLDPVNLRLRPKLFRDLAPGTRVVSHAFHMDDWDHDKLVKHPKARKESIYYWAIPAGVGGVWTWRAESENGPANVRMLVNQEFQVAWGEISFLDRDGRAYRESVDVELHGNEVRFRVETGAEGRHVVLECQGTVKGHVITGRQKWAWADGTEDLEWKAELQRPDLVGIWDVTTPADDSGLGGTLAITRGNRAGDLAATFRLAGAAEDIPADAAYFWGSSVRLEFVSGGSRIFLRGGFDGDTARGTATRDGWNHNCTWAGQRRGGGVSK